ncbi:MAG: M20/M25/M40 family metallo-hydrolase, partial [Candidatus Hodarchaeota archaeon]
EGSNAFNVIPPQSTLRGTFRTMDNDIRDYIVKRIQEIVSGYCEAWRCECEIIFNPGEMIAIPPLINDNQVVEELSAILEDLDAVTEMVPTMGSEDFAFFLQKTKGAFIALGIYNEEKGIIFPHHHPRFDIDEDVLWKGAAMYALLGFYHLFVDES